MADLCTLCGYKDIDIVGIYNQYFKVVDLPTTLSSMKDEEYYSSILGKTCEHCGIHSIGINKKYEVFAGFAVNKPTLKIGEINKETMEMTLFDDLPEYEEERKFKLKGVKIHEQKPQLRNSVEEQLDLTDDEIKSYYNEWLKNDLTNVGLTEILLYQLIRDTKKDLGKNYNKQFDYIKTKYPKNITPVEKLKVEKTSSSKKPKIKDVVKKK